MTLITTIKKIISGILLLCVFVGVMPVEVFGQTAPDMSAYKDWSINIIAKDAPTYAVEKDSWYNKSLTAADYVVSAVSPVGGLVVPFQKYKDYDTATGANLNQGGTAIPVSDEYYRALKGVSGNDLKNPFTGSSYEQEKLYMISDGNSTSIYYKPDSRTNDNTVIIAHAAEKKVYFPKNGFIGKSSGQDQPDGKATDTLTEKGFVSAIDTLNNRAPKTYTNLVYIDQLKGFEQQQQNQDRVVTDLQAKIDADDKAIAENRTSLPADERKKLIADRDAAVGLNNTLKNNISTAKTSLQKNELTLNECKLWSFTDSSCIITLAAIAANIALKLSAFVLYWTGNLFDYSIEIAVNSAEFLKAVGIVEPTWAFVRDALNMTFIFILLFIAVQILLGRGNYNAKGSVARLVLVAILMNFSLFAAKIMVDASNVISLNIYESIKTNDKNSPNRGNVSARIMTTLGLTGIYSFGDAFDNKTVPGCGGVPGTILTVGVFGTILIIITSLVFLLAALLFFLRMLNIIVLFVTSPIWVWGYVMNNAGIKAKTTDEWWNNMWHVMKFPVMFMIMLYVSLALFAQLNTIQVAGGKPRASFIQIICQTTTNNGGQSSIFDKLPLIINFIIVIGCLGGIIGYSVKNSGKAGVLGTGKLATNISSKFDTIQKRFTTGAAQGVYNKSLGAATAVGDKTLTIAKDVGRMGLNKAGNSIANKLGAAATSDILKNLPKAQTALAMLSGGFKDRKIFGETEKEAVGRRQKGAIARAETLATVQADQMKVESEEAWKKKNKNGTAADYKAYLEGKVALIERTQLGNLRKMSQGKDKAGNVQITENVIRDGIYDTVDVKDDQGNVIGTTEKLNEEKLYKNIIDARKFHAKNGDVLKEDKDKRWGVFVSERSEARVKTRDGNIKKQYAEVKKKQGKVKSTAEKKKKVESLKNQLTRLPENFENIPVADKNKYHSNISSYLSQVNKIKSDMTNAINRLGSSSTQADIDRIKKKADDEIDDLKILTTEKVNKERDRIENAIEKNLKEIDTLEAEEEKK